MTSMTAPQSLLWPSKTVLNAATAILVVACALVLLTGPLRRLRESRLARIGMRVVTPADSVTDMRGVAHPLLGRDSLTMLLFLDAACAECRRSAVSYLNLREWAALQGVATRLLLPAKGAALPFGLHSKDNGAFMTAGRAMYERLGMHAFPSVLFIDRAGVVRGRLIGFVGHELRVLQTLDAVEH